MKRHPAFAALAVFVPWLVAQQPTPIPATVAVRVAVERPVPVLGPLQVVPWTLVTDLARDDFEVLADHQPCPVTSFSSRDDPLTLVVLLDVSASTRVDPEWLLEPIRKFLIPALKRGDRVAFGRFGGTRLRLDDRFTDVPDEMERRAKDLLAERRREMRDGDAAGLNGALGLGASPAWDAVDAAVSLLEPQTVRASTLREPQGRPEPERDLRVRGIRLQPDLRGRGPARADARAVILFTDGRSTGNVHSLDEAILHAAAANVPVSVVVETQEQLIRLTETTSARVRPGILLQAMADMTGGGCADVFGPEVGRPQRPDEIKRWLGRVLARLVADLHNGYTLEFAAPAADGQLHRLEVRVKKPGLKVRARQVYLSRQG
jgi:VWFA-related protein